MAPAFDTLPRYYGYRDVVALFPSEDAFLDAWFAPDFPPDIRRACEDTLHPNTLQIWLLRRMTRQLDTLIAVLREGEISVFDSPTAPPSTRRQ